MIPAAHSESTLVHASGCTLMKIDTQVATGHVSMGGAVAAAGGGGSVVGARR